MGWNLKTFTQYGKGSCTNDDCDELIYQNARRILIAEWQNIIYSEWLPLIIGKKRLDSFNLKLDEDRRYNNTIDPSILASFSTAAFRFGHSLVDSTITQKNIKTGKDKKS